MGQPRRGLGSGLQISELALGWFVIRDIVPGALFATRRIASSSRACTCAVLYAFTEIAICRANLDLYGGSVLETTNLDGGFVESKL